MELLSGRDKSTVGCMTSKSSMLTTAISITVHLK